jgi:hypothetical protein
MPPRRVWPQTSAASDIGAVDMGAIFCDIQAATKQPTFDFGAMSVKITDVGSNLECVRSTNFPQNHPDAGDGTDTGQYWHIDGLQGDQLTPAAVDYIFNLTLPHSADLPQDASVCKHVGDTNWVCDRTGADTNTVWLDDITNGFSDWTAGDNVPTAVSLVSFEAHAVSAAGGLFAALLAAAGAAYLSLRRLVSR